MDPPPLNRQRVVRFASSKSTKADPLLLSSPDTVADDKIGLVPLESSRERVEVLGVVESQRPNQPLSPQLAALTGVRKLVRGPASTQAEMPAPSEVRRNPEQLPLNPPDILREGEPPRFLRRVAPEPPLMDVVVPQADEVPADKVEAPRLTPVAPAAPLAAAAAVAAPIEAEAALPDPVELPKPAAPPQASPVEPPTALLRSASDLQASRPFVRLAEAPARPTQQVPTNEVERLGSSPPAAPPDKPQTASAALGLHDPDDGLTSTRRATRIGALTLALTFLGFGGWAALAPLGSAVVAAGNLVVESNRQDVQHLDGGQAARILVRDGVVVAAGDVLIALDPIRVTAQASLIRSQMEAAQLLVARLRAEQVGTTGLTVPLDLAAREGSDVSLAAAIRAQRSIMETRRISFDGQVSVFNQRIRQLREQISGLVAQEQSRVRQLRLLQQELDGVLELLRGGHATRVRALTLEREFARLEGERGEHASNVARLEQAIGETQLQILQLRRSFDEDLASKLQEAEQTLVEAQERLTSAEDQVRRLEIRAPVAGTVVGLAVHAVGAVISPGQVLMQVVPAEDRLLVEAEVRPEDVERLRPGISAVIQFTGLPQVSMPLVTGQLLTISADRLTEQRTGMPYFRARLAVDEESRAKLSDRRIVPGMPVQVMIRTGERTALGYLLDPVTLALARAMQER